MLHSSSIQTIGAVLFALAIAHTFSTKYFEQLAHTQPRHAGLWHLLGEIEVVFGFWAMVLVVCMAVTNGADHALAYLDSRNFTEPLFVFAIMVIAASRPIMLLASRLIERIAAFVPVHTALASYYLLLGVVPLVGSFITEPAAMTLAALMLRDAFFTRTLSNRLKYATIGVLFVNVSIGGTLTPYAAPPILMVAATWNWDIAFMLTHFGAKAVAAVSINALLVTLIFRSELIRLPAPQKGNKAEPPLVLTAVHVLFLVGVVVFAHHPAAFLGLFLFFLGVVSAYARHQTPLILREALLVAFFLAGLVVLGGMQQWWLQPVLMGMSETQVFFGAMALTAFTDNAALTYLGSLVHGLSEGFKIALVSGAVIGGGLTVIANAPNPAGIAILRGNFSDNTVSALGLLLAAMAPTLIAVAIFWFF